MACQRTSSGTLPTMATVAEWRISPVIGPTIVAPSRRRVFASTTSLAVPPYPLPNVADAATQPVLYSTV